MKETKLMFTVIIPHKNEPELLQRCLDSIPLEDDIQIIVIDDDSDAKIVDFKTFPGVGRKNTEIVFLKGKMSKGAGNARNIGLEKAEGQWVLFCDADDYFTDSFYPTIKKYEMSDFEIVIFNIDIPKGVRYQGSVYQNLITEYDETKPETLQDLKYKVWTPWAKLYNKNYLDKINIRFENRKVGNDCYFVLMANDSATKLKVDKTKIYHHYYNNNGLSHKKKQSFERFLERMEVTLWRESLYKKRGFNKYLIGAGIYQTLSDAKRTYGFSAFCKALNKAIKLKADFLTPVKYKIKKIAS